MKKRQKKNLNHFGMKFMKINMILKDMIIY